MYCSYFIYPLKKYLLAVLLLLLCLPVQAQQPSLDLIYGEDLTSLYKRKKVKEVYVESDHYGSGQLLYPRFLSLYELLDKEGRVMRLESGDYENIDRREDYEYDKNGLPTIVTLYVLIGEENATDRSALTWHQTQQHRYVPTGKQPGGTFSWEGHPGKWVRETTLRTWVKNDTTYHETRITYNREEKHYELSRHYTSGPDKTIHRKDYLSFSPKGMSEPKYFYEKIVNGKLMESGEMNFELEVYQYLQQHPEAAKLLFSKRGFYPVMDKVARSSAGRPVPRKTLIYDAKGHLIEEKEIAGATYTRDEAGRAVTRKSLGGTFTNYYYNEAGLLDGVVIVDTEGKPSETKFYRYTFY